jgi:hypothetical protein
MGDAYAVLASHPRNWPSCHYANRTNYRIRVLKVPALVDVETLYITDIHSRASKKHDTKIGPRWSDCKVT